MTPIISHTLENVSTSGFTDVIINFSTGDTLLFVEANLLVIQLITTHKVCKN